MFVENLKTKTMKIKTIDIQAKEWFDKINGNSYFSAIVTVNYGMAGELLKEHIYSPSEYYKEKTINLPFQYGYGEQYIQEAKAALTEHDYIYTLDNKALWTYCKDNDIILRTNIQKGCLKRDVKNFVS